MKVFVVEDQILFQEFLVMLVCDKLRFDLVGVASDGESALASIRESKPDLILLDLLIPRLSGLRVAETLLAEKPTIRILALTSELDPHTLQQVRKLNLAGCVDKSSARLPLLVEAIKSVAAGKRFLCPKVRKDFALAQTDPDAYQKILSPREQEILALIGAGLPDDRIAQLLSLSKSSAQSHRRNIARKLGLHSTPELIRFASENGFWKPQFSRMGLLGNYHLST